MECSSGLQRDTDLPQCFPPLTEIVYGLPNILF